MFERLRQIDGRMAHAPENPERLLGFAESVLSAAQPESGGFDRVLVRVAAEMVLWGFCRFPADRRFTSALQGLDKALKFLTPQCRELVAELDPALTPPEDIEAWLDLKECPDEAAVERYLTRKLEGPGQRVFWAAEGFDWRLRAGQFEAALDVLDRTDWPGRTVLLKERLAAEARHFQPDANAAYKAWRDLPAPIWSPLRSWMCAQAAARGGKTVEAGNLLAALHKAMPWHMSTLLALDGLRNPPACDPQASEDIAAAILIFSWNKAELLSATLERLAATDLGRASLTILDNGSTDATPEVLARAASLFGDRLETVRLPVNIGAPAARNWLLSMPRVREAEWAVFLDDDVLPPTDWLNLLLSTAARTFGSVHAVGCRVVDATPPHRLQMVEINLDPPSDGTSVMIPDPGIGDYDHGLYGHVRPSLSVTGCCHALRVAALEDIGTFDIRFSPTQFDDFERDLRAFSKGYHCIYDGRLAMPHVQNSSLRQADSPARRGQIQGNLVKLNALYAQERMREIVENNQSLLWDDLIAKAARLAE